MENLAQIGRNIVHGHTRIMDVRPAALLELHNETSTVRLDTALKDALDLVFAALATNKGIEAAADAYIEAIYRGVAAKQLEIVGPSQLSHWRFHQLDIWGRLRRCERAPGSLERFVEHTRARMLPTLEEDYMGYFPWLGMDLSV